ncbi:hypothetical protein ON010_g16519 [Phytophthora cinnamomi]|nr:hypothetical protein ON010_g16519 [Phytophthora cinnamomi]
MQRISAREPSHAGKRRRGEEGNIHAGQTAGPATQRGGRERASAPTQPASSSYAPGAERVSAIVHRPPRQAAASSPATLKPAAVDAVGAAVQRQLGRQRVAAQHGVVVLHLGGLQQLRERRQLPQRGRVARAELRGAEPVRQGRAQHDRGRRQALAARARPGPLEGVAVLPLGRGQGAQDGPRGDLPRGARGARQHARVQGGGDGLDRAQLEPEEPVRAHHAAQDGGPHPGQPHHLGRAHLAHAAHRQPHGGLPAQEGREEQGAQEALHGAQRQRAGLLQEEAREERHPAQQGREEDAREGPHRPGQSLLAAAHGVQGRALRHPARDHGAHVGHLRRLGAGVPALAQGALQEVSAKAITDVRMVVTTGDTVGQIVEHIFNCYEQALDAAPLRPYNPAEYRLKITGYRDYMIDRFRVLNEYMHVRECLLTKKTIRLTVIHESVIQETAMMNLSIGRDLPVSTGSMNNLVNQFADMFDGASDYVVADDDAGGIIQQPFAIRIRRVLNISRTTCVGKRSSEEAIVTRVPLTSSSVIVRIELYDGGQLLENAVIDTSDVRLKAQRNDLLYAEWEDPVWHKFNIDICNVTRTMRVQLTVLGVKKIVGSSASNMDATEEKMLVTGVNAFEVDDTLTQGQQYVHMYNNLHSCIQGPVPHVTLPNEPMIQVEFSKFDTPIKFDWNDDDSSSVSDRSHRRSSRRNQPLCYAAQGGVAAKSGQLFILDSLASSLVCG